MKLNQGFDILFFNSRLLLTFNHFKNNETYNLPANTFYGVPEYTIKGWETELRYWPIRKKNFSIETAVLLSRTNSRVNRLGMSHLDREPIVSTRWFNNLTYKSLILTLLIEAVDNYPPYLEPIGGDKVSFTKLREVSLGFNLPRQWFSNTFIDGGTFSVTGRNLVNLGGSDDHDAQEFNSTLFVKSVSFSLSLNF